MSYKVFLYYHVKQIRPVASKQENNLEVRARHTNSTSTAKQTTLNPFVTVGAVGLITLNSYVAEALAYAYDVG